MRTLDIQTFNCSFSPYADVPSQRLGQPRPIFRFSLNVLSYFHSLRTPFGVGCPSVHCQSLNPQMTSTYHFVKSNLQVPKGEVHTATNLSSSHSLGRCACSYGSTHSLQTSPRDARKAKRWPNVRYGAKALTMSNPYTIKHRQNMQDADV